MDRPNLKDMMADDIRRRIFAGDLLPGSKIDQEHLAAQAGVSRLPVREALIQLSEEGLVRTIPRRGAYVAHIDRADIQDRYHVYGTLSGMAAARAVGRLTPDDIAHLHVTISAIHTSQDADTRERLTQEFHRTINRAGASGFLRSTLRTLRNSQPKILYMHEQGRGDEAERQLTEIVQAIESGDSTRAEGLVVRHFRFGAQYAVAALEAEGFWDRERVDNTPKSAETA
jgi:DNA-binding GntR family transcriptional regulator